MKILTILGARPQFIKAAAFSADLSEFNRKVSAGKETGRRFDRSLYLEESEEGGGSLLSDPPLNQKSSSAVKGSVAIQEKILHTGQHYDFELSEQFFQQLGKAILQSLVMAVIRGILSDQVDFLNTGILQ